jgi:hypothetical protein
MANAGLALLLALSVEPARPEDETALSGTRLERRIAERGPVRTRLEAALAMPAIEIASHARVARAQGAQNAPPKSDHFWAGFVAGCLVLVLGLFLLAATNDSWF